MNGSFTVVSVPTEVEVGQDIKITVGFQAINPGDVYWKTFIIMSSSQLFPIEQELDATREWGEQVGRTKEFNLGPMPDRQVGLYLTLWGNDDVGYDWDWDYYHYWLDTNDDYAAKHLDSASAFILPKEPISPLGFEGHITDFSVKNETTYFVSFNAYARNFLDYINGWHTRLVLNVGGYTASDIQFHLGQDGSRSNQELHLGRLSPGIHNGTLTLEAKSLITGSWELLDTWGVTIDVLEPNGEPGEPGEPDEKSSLLPIAIGVIILGVGIVGFGTRKKKA